MLDKLTFNVILKIQKWPKVAKLLQGAMKIGKIGLKQFLNMAKQRSY